ncbi:MAG: type II secretion system F family protein [Lachnospiraceae bacterium]|nr:type II secretion system F family protein [Lachnospiraceae bacterium]
MELHQIAEACAAGGILLSAAALLFISRREQVPAQAGENPPRPLTRVSAYLYRRLPPFGGAERVQSVREDLAVLYPSRSAEGRAAAYEILRIRRILLCVLAGGFLTGAALLQDLAGGTGEGIRRIERDGYGGTGTTVSLTASVEGAEGQGMEIPVSVRARQYSARQLERLAGELFTALEEVIPGQNRSLEAVAADLCLPAEVEGYPFRIRWESDAPDWLDSGGRVHAAFVPERPVQLTALLTGEGADGSCAFEHTYVCRGVRTAESENARLRQKLLSEIASAEEKSAGSSFLELPQTVQADDGTARQVSWRETGEERGLQFLFLGAAAAVLLSLLEDRRLHGQVRERERQLEADYPQLVNRLALYLGAGMSLRNIFYRIGEDYRKQRARGAARRCVCEEVLLLIREMESGTPEAEAYTHFGSRCRCGMYIRLCTLLTQNLRKGNRELLQALRREAETALLERKNTARQRGEEAETRLLLPMVAMLAITMVIIIIPAYLSFTV